MTISTTTSPELLNGGAGTTLAVADDARMSSSHPLLADRAVDARSPRPKSCSTFRRMSRPASSSREVPTCVGRGCIPPRSWSGANCAMPASWTPRPRLGRPLGPARPNGGGLASCAWLEGIGVRDE